MKTAEMVLQQMQVFDQQITTPLTAAEKRLNFGQSDWINLPTLRVVRPAPTPRTGMNAAVVI
jgi:hypothetical protein